MQFNSYSFILVFLPLTVLGFSVCRHVHSDRLAVLWLCGASLVFYSWDEPSRLAVLVVSIVLNYLLGITLRRWGGTLMLAAGVTVNIAFLAVSKYARVVPDGSVPLAASAVALGISFLTVQQIMYLVDSARGEIPPHRFVDYCLILTFFPRVIAGPLVRYSDALPQITTLRRQPLLDDLAVGGTFFVVGLFKKVVVADRIAPYADAVFRAAASGTSVTLFEAWGGALAYTLQLYFDFSGYSDMAVGLARMFGLRLPFNFDSPYKASSVIDFWRRWHITLSRFLWEYMYFPLAARGRGIAQRYAGLVLTMAVAGLWHGIGVTLLCWGLLHGVYLVINHAWRDLKRRAGWHRAGAHPWDRPLATFVTFTAVVVAWVFFRAPTVEAALVMLRGMAGQAGVSLPPAHEPTFAAVNVVLRSLGVSLDGLGAFASIPGAGVTRGVCSILLLLGIVWFAPNTQQWMGATGETRDGTTPTSRWRWRAGSAWGAIAGAMTAASFYFMFARGESFVYFRF